jgi:hypothetical protein
MLFQPYRLLFILIFMNQCYKYFTAVSYDHSAKRLHVVLRIAWKNLLQLLQFYLLITVLSYDRTCICQVWVLKTCNKL